MAKVKVAIECLTDEEIEKLAADSVARGDRAQAEELRDFVQRRRSGTLKPETADYFAHKGVDAYGRRLAS